MPQRSERPMAATLLLPASVRLQPGPHLNPPPPRPNFTLVTFGCGEVGAPYRKHADGTAILALMAS